MTRLPPRVTRGLPLGNNSNKYIDKYIDNVLSTSLQDTTDTTDIPLMYQKLRPYENPDSGTWPCQYIMGPPDEGSDTQPMGDTNINTDICTTSNTAPSDKEIKEIINQVCIVNGSSICDTLNINITNLGAIVPIIRKHTLDKIPDLKKYIVDGKPTRLIRLEILYWAEQFRTDMDAPIDLRDINYLQTYQVSVLIPVHPSMYHIYYM